MSVHGRMFLIYINDTVEGINSCTYVYLRMMLSCPFEKVKNKEDWVVTKRSGQPNLLEDKR